MMRIGIDARLWNETGVGRYIRNLVSELQVLDKKNEYFLFLRSLDRQQLTINNSQLTKNHSWKIVEADIRWHTVEEQLKFPQILEKENLDLVHFPYFSVPINYKKPYVITIHDLILNHFPTGKASTLPIPLYQAKRLGYKYVLSSAIKNARKVIVPLNAVKADLLKSYKVQEDKIEVTYEGVDEKISNFKFQISNSQKHKRDYFLYVGNAYPHKNLDRLIEAFEMLKQVQHDINLLLVGKDDYFYKKLRDKVEKEKIPGIIFRHDVSDQELSDLYRNARAFVSASLMEGFGLPALEAMASACLVLVSAIPSFREVVKDSAIYFDPYNINELANKLSEIASNSDTSMYQSKIEKGLKRARDFSWKKMAQETLKVYESSIQV